ncbi:MAG: hypothetical protein LBM38_01835 [Clostridiales bacterium]|nr:hypothetical protein [Clostridiales bacterium]
MSINNIDSSMTYAWAKTIRAFYDENGFLPENYKQKSDYEQKLGKKMFEIKSELHSKYGRGTINIDSAKGISVSILKPPADTIDYRIHELLSPIGALEYIPHPKNKPLPEYAKLWIDYTKQDGTPPRMDSDNLAERQLAIFMDHTIKRFWRKYKAATPPESSDDYKIFELLKPTGLLPFMRSPSPSEQPQNTPYSSFKIDKTIIPIAKQILNESIALGGNMHHGRLLPDELFTEAFNSLSKNRQIILSHRLGLFGAEKLTNKQIVDKYNYTSSPKFCTNQLIAAYRHLQKFYDKAASITRTTYVDQETPFMAIPISSVADSYLPYFPIMSLDLNTHSYLCLVRAGITTIDKLLEITAKDNGESLLHLPRLGERSHSKIMSKIQRYLENDVVVKNTTKESDNNQVTQTPIDNDIKITVAGVMNKNSSFSDSANDIDISELHFSVRAFNCLRRFGIKTVADLINTSEDELKQIHYMGKTTLDEIKMKIKDYKLLEQNSDSSVDNIKPPKIINKIDQVQKATSFDIMQKAQEITGLNEDFFANLSSNTSPCFLNENTPLKNIDSLDKKNRLYLTHNYNIRTVGDFEKACHNNTFDGFENTIIINHVIEELNKIQSIAPRLVAQKAVVTALFKLPPDEVSKQYNANPQEFIKQWVPGLNSTIPKSTSLTTLTL